MLRLLFPCYFVIFLDVSGLHLKVERGRKESRESGEWSAAKGQRPGLEPGASCKEDLQPYSLISVLTGRFEMKSQFTEMYLNYSICLSNAVFYPAMTDGLWMKAKERAERHWQIMEALILQSEDCQLGAAAAHRLAHRGWWWKKSQTGMSW